MKKLWFIVLFLAACAGNPTPQVALPTVAELPTLTPTESPVPSATPTDTLTPTSTFTPTVTPTLTATVTPSTTITDTPSPTPTNTATPTPRQGALFLLAQLADSVTVLPQELRPSPATPFVSEIEGTLTPGVGLTAAPVTCAVPPPGGFGTVFINNPGISGLIGCPQGTVTSATSAEQAFERGTMIWLSGPIYVLYGDGRLQQFTDTFNASIDPERGGETPPSGLIEPVRGFGKLWRSSPEVRGGLGWGVAAEAGGSAAMLRFERGWIIDLTQRGDILVLAESAGTWQSYVGNY